MRNPLAKWLVFAALCLLPVLGALRCLGNEAFWPALVYPVASALCFILYWHDKNSAQQGRQRTSEKTLHLVELAGGWPGALLAQQTFRHKTRKASYQLVFWAIVALHQLVWIDQLLLGGAYTSGWLRSLL